MNDDPVVLNFGLSDSIQLSRWRYRYKVRQTSAYESKEKDKRRDGAKGVWLRLLVGWLQVVDWLVDCLTQNTIIESYWMDKARGWAVRQS